MLSRSGKKVYWLGRYLERVEFITHFMKVHFFSLMDLPSILSKKDMLESVLFMANQSKSYYAMYKKLNVADVLNFVSIEEANPTSILADVTRVRELASGIRDALTPELWEYINFFYHTMTSYGSDAIKKEGIYGFAHKIETNTAIIKGYIHDSMIRNEVWKLLSLGIYLERVLLVNKMLLHHMKSIIGRDLPDQNYVFLVESIGSYGMFKQEYNKNASKDDALHFLVLNKDFPKSITFNLACIHTIFKNLCCLRQKDQSSLELASHSILKQFENFNPTDQNDLIVDFIEKMMDNLNELARRVEQTFQKALSKTVPNNN